MLHGKDLVSIRDLEKGDIELILRRAAEMDKALGTGKPIEILKRKIVATLFFEPSTRTKMSFQTAAKRVGAQIINLTSVESSSLKKGETLADTLRMVDGYSDLIVIRHAAEGAARYAAEICQRPVVNAGDGGNQHPTQTLLDLYTITKMKGKLEGLSVYLVGDLKYARTMRSLLYGLAMFGADVTLVAPEGLEMNPGVIKEAKERFGAKVREHSAMELGGADVAYVCRIQKERFADPYEAEKVQKTFRITMDALRGVKDDLAILHPLPKIDEMDPEIDKTKYARYFEQAKLGVPVRMAILAEIMGA
jgi:aspartate carbamoyltransferase catalytic subunit